MSLAITGFLSGGSSERRFDRGFSWTQGGALLNEGMARDVAERFRLKADYFEELARTEPPMPRLQKSWSSRFLRSFWLLAERGWNLLVGVYMVTTFVLNSIWKIGLTERQKSYRPLNSSKPLKVGIVSEYYYPHMGGLSGDVHYAAIEFAKRGYDTCLITPNTFGVANPTTTSLGFRIIRLGWAIPYFANGSLAKICGGFFLGRQIRDMLKREKFDIIHIHCQITPVLPLLIQRYADCPIVGHHHTLFRTKPFFFKWFPKALRRFVHDFDGLVAVSEHCAKQYRQWLGGSFKVIPNGVEVAWIRDEKLKVEAFDDGRINLFFIGRMEFRNGVSVLLEAFKIIHEQEPKTRLLLAGGGPLKPYFESLVDESIRDSVVWLGPILEEKARYFQTADIQICPTWPVAASLGVILLEAMASGKPTVASDIPAFNETAADGEEVLMAHPYKPEEFASQVVKLIRDRELGQRLAAAALKRMETAYDWSQIIERVDAYAWDVALNSLKREGSCKVSELNF